MFVYHYLINLERDSPNRLVWWRHYDVKNEDISTEGKQGESRHLGTVGIDI